MSETNWRPAVELFQAWRPQSRAEVEPVDEKGEEEESFDPPCLWTKQLVDSSLFNFFFNFFLKNVRGFLGYASISCQSFSSFSCYYQCFVGNSETVCFFLWLTDPNQHGMCRGSTVVPTCIATLHDSLSLSPSLPPPKHSAESTFNIFLLLLLLLLLPWPNISIHRQKVGCLTSMREHYLQRIGLCRKIKTYSQITKKNYLWESQWVLNDFIFLCPFLWGNELWSTQRSQCWLKEAISSSSSSSSSTWDDGGDDHFYLFLLLHAVRQAGKAGRPLSLFHSTYYRMGGKVPKFHPTFFLAGEEFFFKSTSH